MILTTTSSIEGKVPTAYLGVIGAEVIFGANIFKDWMAEGADIIGGRNTAYEATFEDARKEAVKILEARASQRGANAVLNVRFNYSVLGAANGMLMVAATGTCVALVLTKDEQARENAREKASQESYWIKIENRLRGPFSVLQLRELVASGKLTDNDHVYGEDGQEGSFVGELVSSAPTAL